jgi:sugar lactone lactonase YvrE
MFEVRPIAGAVSAAALTCLTLASCAGSGSSVPATQLAAPALTNPMSRAFQPNAAPKALYVSDNIGKSVFRFVLNGDGTLKTPAGSSLVLPYNPGPIAVGPNGYLYVISLVNNSIQGYRPHVAGKKNPFRQIKLSFQPTGIAVDANGYIYVSGSTTGYTAVFAPFAHGPATPVQIISLPDRHFTVNGVAVDSGGNMYMSDTNEISVFSTPTSNPTLQRAIIGNGQQAAPAGMAFDAGNELYATNPGNQNILAYSPTANGTSPADRVISANPALVGDTADAVNGTNLYVNSQNPGAIYLLNTTQGGTQTPKQIVTASYMPAPVGVALGP